MYAVCSISALLLEHEASDLTKVMEEAFLNCCAGGDGEDHAVHNFLRYRLATRGLPVSMVLGAVLVPKCTESPELGTGRRLALLFVVPLAQLMDWRFSARVESFSDLVAGGRAEYLKQAHGCGPMCWRVPFNNLTMLADFLQISGESHLISSLLQRLNNHSQCS